LGLGACATSIADELVEEAPVELAHRSLGSASNTAIMLEVSNATVKNIVGFEVLCANDEDYGSALITNGSRIVTGETVVLFFEPVGLEPELYDVALTFNDSSRAVLHGICLEELVFLKICTSNSGTTHAEYKDVKGIRWNTLDRENAIRQIAEAAEAALLAQAEAEALAEAEAEAEAAAAAAAQSYSGGYSYNTGGGGAAAPSAASQAPDVCVDDLVFTF